MSNDYRKVRPIQGTIFDKARRDDPVMQQRRWGFLYRYGVNPAGVAKGGVHIESLGDGKVRVYYEAVYLPPEQDPWPESIEGRNSGVPAGIWCDHGGYKKRHIVTQIRSFDASLTEVLA